jgi:myo-inositol 2-dehydrogenase / D-chiro-inositol 1-dehydrogenase
VPASALGREGKPPASERIVIGSIGVGDLGRRHHLANMLLGSDRVDIAAVCDVDQLHREEAAEMVLKRRGKRVGCYKDFREVLDHKDIDAVFVVTPDHWHALISIAAVEAGKDVYCEKPLTLTIDESKAVLAAARRYGAVFQTGSQQRSERRFRHACELVRNGKIGKVERVTTHIGDIDSGSWEQATTPPPNLDWNFWLGPAPYVPYTANRCHYQFRWFSDYSGGKMTDWGAHHNDIAQWGIGADGSGPIQVEGTGKFHENGPHDVPGEFEVHYKYGPQHGNVELVCYSGGENGVNFIGSDGKVFVSRGRIELNLGDKTYSDDHKKIGAGENLDIFKEFPADSFATKLYESNHHHNNFFDCVASRKRPICDVEVGHRSVTVCHLGNIAIRLGRPLKWDPVKEDFVDDSVASRFVAKPMRSPWHV